MPPAARSSHSPVSHDEEHPGTGLHSRSRNARAQARHRAKRKAYIENLEANVKRLQAIVDANGLDPAAPPPPPAAHAPHPHPYVIHELQAANDRLRREADEMRVQLEALMSAHVAGAHVTPPQPAATPPPDKKRRTSAERERTSIYLASASVPSAPAPPRPAPAALIAPQPPILAPRPPRARLAHLNYLQYGHPRLAQPRRLEPLEPLDAPSLDALPRPATGRLQLALQPRRIILELARIPAPPPGPAPHQLPARARNLPSSSLLATSLYPLLTLGIAGGAVSGELGAAAWNAFQQSQMAQAQAGSSQMHESHSNNHLHSSYLSHSQPMSTLSSERTDSPANLQNPLESIRASSPRYSASSSPGSFGPAGPSSSSSPRFDTAPFDTRYEPGGSAPRFDTRYDAQFDSQPYQFGPAPTPSGSRSGSGSGSGSPHFATPAPVPARTTPPGYGSSSSSTPPGGALGQGGRRGSGSSGASVRVDGR
ncbi:hypothetical protein FRC06_005358 [Ceratobasidium sp. 370]|nr:hypothetical protein FRC06_005358 [Ceratobasidium sp. 370]